MFLRNNFRSHPTRGANKALALVAQFGTVSWIRGRARRRRRGLTDRLSSPPDTGVWVVLVLGKGNGDAKVSQQHRPIIINEQVSGLDIAVNKAVDVEVAFGVVGFILSAL